MQLQVVRLYHNRDVFGLILETKTAKKKKKNSPQTLSDSNCCWLTVSVCCYTSHLKRNKEKNQAMWWGDWRDCKATGIFCACQVGSGLKSCRSVSDAEFWGSGDHPHSQSKIQIHLSPVCRDDSVYLPNKLSCILPAAIFKRYNHHCFSSSPVLLFPFEMFPPP